MRLFLTESLVDGERSQSKSFSSCARIGRIFSFSASSPLRFNSSTSSSNSCFIKIIVRLIRNIRKCYLLRHGSDKTLQVGYANHFYRSAHKFEQICRHRLRRQNVGYSNFSQPQSHLSFCILILNSFLGSSDSLVFSELFHSLAPRPLAARSISDFLLTYLAT